MAPSDFPTILICGRSGPLPNTDPLMNPVYNPCAQCNNPTWRRCSKCGDIFYCSMEHEYAHWHVHKRSCPSARVPEHDRRVEERRAMIRPLKCYEVGPTEKVLRASSFYFGPNYICPQQVVIKYRPAGVFDCHPVGPWPILGKYFAEDAPHCVLVESDGDNTLNEPIAIWFSKEALHARRSPNDAILSLFGPDEQPKHKWRGPVVVMKFAGWDYHDFVPVTHGDLISLKMYFSNYLGLDEVW